jgi:hypothetical protein
MTQQEALKRLARSIWRDSNPGITVYPLKPEIEAHRCLADRFGATQYTLTWLRRDLVQVLLFLGENWISTHVVSIADFTADGFETLVARVTELEDRLAAMEQRAKEERKQ